MSPAALGRLRGAGRQADSPVLRTQWSRPSWRAGMARGGAVAHKGGWGGVAQSVSAAGEDVLAVYVQAVVALDMACCPRSPPRYRSRSDHDTR